MFSLTSIVAPQNFQKPNARLSVYTVGVNRGATLTYFVRIERTNDFLVRTPTIRVHLLRTANPSCNVCDIVTCLRRWRDQKTKLKIWWDHPWLSATETVTSQGECAFETIHVLRRNHPANHNETT